MQEIVIELKDCVANPLFGINEGTSYVQVYGENKQVVVQQIEEMVNGNSESNGVGKVRALCSLPNGESLSQEWTAYLETKDPKLFENNL